MATRPGANQKSIWVDEKGKFAQDFGLKGQIQRAASSSMHNIAEGFDSDTNTEFVRFLRYSRRSCSEVQSELYVALDQQYITRWSFKTSMTTLDERVQRSVALLDIC